ncbi:ferredoxin [Streptomyces sp. MP131-18]|uniref:ferredoxin n=1 Tax=Streptomyces sp. MP131-18 TaxID=1857892 RepID=UPI00209ABE8A|nr:ferredoxin [Streptomyces sp. MP131-18]
MDRTLCYGTGLCEAMAPAVFSLTDEGYAVARPAGDRAAGPERLREIAECCPAGAITVTGPGAGTT